MRNTQKEMNYLFHHWGPENVERALISFGPGSRSAVQDLTLSTPGQTPQLPVNYIENNPNKALTQLF